MVRRRRWALLFVLAGSVRCGGDAGGGPATTGGGASAAGGGGVGGGRDVGASAGNGGGSSSSGGSPNSGGSSGAGSSGGGSSGAAGRLGPDAGSDAGADATSPRPCPGARPSAANTGVPPGVALTVVNGDVTIRQDGTSIDAEDIHGFVVVMASHVRITRSLVRGGMATSNGAGIRIASGTDIVIEDTEVGLANPSPYLDGVSGSNFIVRHANIHGGVDGMKVGSNGVVECSFIHDLVSFASDPNQGGGPTHNDAIQILSGSTIRIVGNALLASTDQNAAIQVTQDFGAVSDLSIEANFADGGGCTFNLSHKGGPPLAVSTSGNRFGRNSFFNCPILKSTQTTLTSSGDVWDDDGTPVPVQTHD